MSVKITNGAERPSLWLYGTIGADVMVDDVRDALKEIGAKNDFDMHIYSDGGDFYEAMAIKSLLNQHKGKKFAIVDGLAASAASVLFQTGSVRTMAKNSRQMIHEAHGRIGSFMKAREFREAAEQLDALNNEVLSIYSDRWKGSKADLQAALMKDTWLSAEESVNVGLADRIGESMAIAARVNADVFNYANVPEDVEVTSAPGVPEFNYPQKTAMQAKLEALGV